MKKKKLDNVDWECLMEQYINHKKTVIDMAKEIGVTRLTLYNHFKRMGCDTSKRKFAVICTACGKETLKNRKRIMKSQHLFCDADCYYAWLNRGNSRIWRQGQRIARAVIKQYFDLQPGNIVHHIDGDNWNNNIDNLMVFASQRDHIRYHRDFESTPIWRY